tara:strand:- start:1133 stop:1411 length:279 start_codon:yes stop_codon:yes gene_type:complete
MNKEEIYDSEISPLMAKIIETCNANNIAMLMSFSIPTEDEPDLECTTALLGDEMNPPEHLRKALNVIRPPSRSVMITERNSDNKITSMTAVI